MKNLKFLLFPTYVLVPLIKFKLQIHPVSPTNPDVFKFIKNFLVFIKIQNLSFIH